MDPFTHLLIAFALSVTSYVLSAALGGKAKPPKPAALEDMQIPQVDEGTEQPVVFGDCWSPGWMVLWYGNLRTKKIKAEGKK